MAAKWRWFRGKTPRDFHRKLNKKKFEEILLKKIKLATERGAQELAAQTRKSIKTNKYKLAPDSLLTIAIKGSSKPLVDSAQLFQSITHQMLSPTSAFVGVLKAKSALQYNIARTLHEGARIKVTPKMRALFTVLWFASKNKDFAAKLDGRAAELFRRNKNWLPLSALTRSIVIPRRPFMMHVFRDKNVINLIKNRWGNAVKLVFEQQAKAKS